MILTLKLLYLELYINISLLIETIILLQICAPRTILSIIIKNNDYVESLQGICYSGQMSSTTLEPEMSEINNFGNYCSVIILT